MRKNATKIAALALSLALTVTSVNIPTNASAASVKLNQKKATLYVSGAKTKKTTTLKVTGTKKKVTFTSNKKSVATVSSKGKVTAKKAGKATITAKVGKKSYKCVVTVKKKYTPVTSLSVSPKTVSLKVGKTKTIKATVKPSKPTEKGVTYKSSKTSVATVSSKGKITAKKAGKATITVTTKGATKTKSNKKATVAVTVTKDDTKPTDSPSTAPSDTPSDTPTDVPTDAPTDTPTDAPTDAPTTLGNITELKATKASQLTATFDSGVPADTKIEVAKGSSAIEGKSTIDGSTVIFDATANLTAGTYTLTATLGENKVSADVEVKDSYVAEIKITSKEALTAEGAANTVSGSAVTETEKFAYIYYDVLNQYGESIRNSTTINWTTSVGNDTKKIDKSLGKITVSNGTTSFTYGSLIYVTGVHVGTGTTISESIPVGMAQAVNSIEFAGFINKNDSTKLVDSLPTNFAKNTYVLAYRTFDQNGNPLTVKGTEIKDGDLTFIGDNVLLIDSSIKDAETTYTIDGVEYSAVTIEPGDYVGRGGEVNITAIANKTGQKTTKNFVVGAAGQLQSLALSTPANVVADGDQGVKLPYVAKDVNGETITNYETIVRSSNTLTLTCTEGDLQVKEENDGTAGIYWSDTASKATVFDSSSVDNVDRSVSIGTIVVGGESNILVLPVSDARRPVAVKSVKLNDDDNNAIVDRATADIGILSDKIVYLDQYGAELWGNNGIVSAYFNKTINNYKYGVKVKTDGNKDIVGLTDSIYDAANNTITINAASSAVKSTTVRFSVAAATSSSSRTDYNAWDNVDSEKNIAYTVVPFTELTNHSISSISKQEIKTSNSDKANGMSITTTGSALDADANGDLTVVANNTTLNGPQSNAFSVTGEYSGKTITVPASYYTTATGSAFTINGSTLAGIVSGELKWNELYDENTARLTRIDAVKKLVLKIDNGTPTTDDDVTLTKNVTVSDAEAGAADVKFLVEWWNTDATEITIQPNNMEIAHHVESWANAYGGHGFGTMNLQILVFDQYGKLYQNSDLDFHGVDTGNFTELTVSDIKENTGDFAHVPSSIKVVQNGSTLGTLKVTGAELGDTFTLKAAIPGTNISKSINIKVGADSQSNIQAGVSGTFDNDKTFRMDKLGYKK